MRDEPVWLTDRQVIRINQRLVQQSNEPHLLVAPALLASGIARPRNRWAYGEADVIHLAGILLLGIGMNHPFQQGNKRTAIAAAKIFLDFNGYRLIAPDGDELAALIEGSIVGRIAEPTLLRALQSFAIPVKA